MFVVEATGDDEGMRGDEETNERRSVKHESHSCRLVHTETRANAGPLLTSFAGLEGR